MAFVCLNGALSWSRRAPSTYELLFIAEETAGLSFLNTSKLFLIFEFLEIMGLGLLLMTMSTSSSYDIWLARMELTALSDL